MLLGTVSLSLMLLVPVMAACAQPAPAPAPAPAPTPAPAPQKTSFIVAGPPVEWGPYTEAVGWTEVINKYTDLTLTLESLPGGEAAVGQVVQGYADMGYPGNGSDAVALWHGIDEYSWSPAKNIRFLFGGISTNKMAFMTSGKTGIKTMADLKGKIIGRDIESAKEIAETNALLRTYGLDPEKDVKWHTISGGDEGWAEINLGRMDVVLDFAHEGLLSVQEDVGEVVIIGFEPEKLKQVEASNPELFRGYMSIRLEPGFIVGLKMSAPVNMMGIIVPAIASDELPDDIAYTVVMTIAAHAAEIAAVKSSTKEFAKEKMLYPAGVAAEIPWHPGAIKAYQELGLWTAEHEKQQQEALAAAR